MAPDTYREILARNIRAARSRVGIGQEDVAIRMRALGHDAWIRQTVGATERGRRRPTAEEVLGLAYVLKTTVDRLMTPLWEDKWVEFPSGMTVRVGAVVTLVTGAPGDVPNDLGWYKNTPVQAIVPPAEAGNAQRGPEGRWHRGTEESELTVDDLATRPIPAEAGKDRPIVAAIITSDRGMLISRRREGKIRWGFITGEIEPDESPKDAAEREAKEETGLEVRAGKVIGELNPHPISGKHMIYMTAVPVRDTDVFVGDENELVEVRWVSLAEAIELMPTMFGPVREHLARELGEG